MRRDAMYAIILVGFGFFLMSQRTGAAFYDTETHLYKDAIHYVQDQGSVRGYPDGTYRPDQPINRAEFVKIIVESAFPGSIGADCFPDVRDQWFAPFVCTAKDKGFVGGYPDGTFKPDRRVNFAEAAKIIVTGFALPTVSDPVWYKPFTDALRERNAVPPSIAELDQELTRGEMAAIIYALKGGGQSLGSGEQSTKRDDFGCWPSSCSIIPDPQGQQQCVDWKAGKTIQWGDCYLSGQPACTQLCEFETSGRTVEQPKQQEAGKCDLAPLRRQFSNTPYYTGPLFDDHYHMPMFFKVPDHPDAPVIDREISRSEVACLFDGERVKGVFAFYSVPANLKDSS